MVFEDKCQVLHWQLHLQLAVTQAQAQTPNQGASSVPAAKPIPGWGKAVTPVTRCPSQASHTMRILGTLVLLPMQEGKSGRKRVSRKHGVEGVGGQAGGNLPPCAEEAR